MPAPVLKALAKKTEKSLDDLERYWKEAKISAKDKGFSEDEDRFWAYTMGIVKKRAGLSESLREFIDDVLWVLDEEETKEVRDYIDADKTEKPAELSLLSQYSKDTGLSEEEVLKYWDAAMKEAKKFQAETGLEGKDMVEYAMKIFAEMMPTPDEQKEKEEAAKAEEEESKEKEKEESVPADEEKEEVEETFAAILMGDHDLVDIDEALGNVISKEELEAMKKAGLKVDKMSKMDLDKKIKELRKNIKKSKKNNILSLFGIGAAGFLGGFAAGKALDAAFSMFRTK